MKQRKFSSEERKYWAGILVAISQVTFGVAWASLFIPLDKYRIFMVGSNLVASIILWLIGWSLIRRIK